MSTDRRRFAGPIVRDRFAIITAPASDHMRGWIHHGMGLPLPPDSTVEFSAGYFESHRNVQCLRLVDAAVRVRP